MRIVGLVVLATTLCSGVASAQGITLELVSSSLSSPVDAISPPGDTERLFVVEQPGRIRIIDLATDSVMPSPFLNIASRVRDGGERGLLGLAFHPNYDENGYFYVYYTRSRTGVCNASPPPGCVNNRDNESVISRFEVSSSNPNVAVASSEQILLTFCQPYGNHNGGGVRFSPIDNYLYISTGDGGSGGDPCNSGQRMNTYLGKMLRIDVDNQDPGLEYAIPESNPYVDTEGALPEIWALGLRNPWRFSFDSANGDMYIGDVGQGSREEIDYQPGTSTGGENYEWKVREGNQGFRSVAWGPGDRVGPVHDYPRGTGTSVTGGVVYRGSAIPGIVGRYFFADYGSDRIWSFVIDNGNRSDFREHTRELNEGLTNDSFDDISAFGVDGRGEMYICDLGTKLFRVIPTGPVNNPPNARIETNPSPPDVTLANGTATVFVDGSSSDDGDGGADLSFLWTKVEGPTGGDDVANPTAASSSIVFSEKGQYTFRLTVDDSNDTDTADVTVTVREPLRPQFVRGDSNGDGSTDLSDGVRTLVNLFVNPEATLACLDASDSNDSGDIDTSDAIFTFNFLFLGGPSIPAPRACGPDDSEDDLGCDSFPPCE